MVWTARTSFLAVCSLFDVPMHCAVSACHPSVVRFFGAFIVRNGLDDLFSGFGQRFSDSLFVVALLLVRAVARGCIKLPPEMIVEIQMAERKADDG